MRTIRTWIAPGLILAGCVALGTGCAAAGTPVTLPPSAPESTVTVAGSPLLLDEHAMGKTVAVTVGTSVELVLHSSYWNIDNSSNPKVLAEIGQPTYLPATSACVPGGGCDPVRATFTAMTQGTAVLSASRMSCGEAMGCAPGQRHFQVTVIVSG